MNSQHGPDTTAQEEALAAALQNTARGLEPPVGELAAAGLAKGRRMRHVRRFGVLGATAAVAAVATITAVMLPGDSPETVGPAAGPASSVAAPKSPVTKPAEKLTGKDVREAVEGLLPSGVTVAWDKDWDPSNGVSVNGVLTDAEGSGQILATVERRPAGETVTCPDLSGTDATCVNETLPDGGVLRLEKNWEYPATSTTDDDKAGPHGAGAVHHTAQVLRDGVSVYLTVTDTAQEKGEQTRPTPVLTLEQVKALVTAPVWTTLPEPAEADHWDGRKPTRRTTP